MEDGPGRIPQFNFNISNLTNKDNLVKGMDSSNYGFKAHNGAEKIYIASGSIDLPQAD